MNKYRGKYQKCRQCKRVIHIGMSLVFVNDTCPHAMGYSNNQCVDKVTCETCESFELKEELNERR